MSMAGLAGVAVSQGRSTSVDSVAALNQCLVTPPRDDGRTEDGFIVLPIHFLFVDGQTRPVSELLCIVPASPETTEFDWFRIDRKTRQATKMHTRLEASHLLRSPDGKYLAVNGSYEGIQTIEIVDLPALMRRDTYTVIDEISSFPGSVSMEEWKGRELHVTSDMLLSHEGRNGRLFLLSDEIFAWNVETGAVVAQSASLRDPVQYFCDKVSNPQGNDRELAILALFHLKKQSAISCLESALGTESDEAKRKYMQAEFQELAKAVALQRECLSVSPGDLNANEVVVESVGALFSGGRSTPIDAIVCIANSTDGEGNIHQFWFRFDRAKPDSGIDLLRDSDDHRVERMRASPDGKYLAVQSDYVDIVDLSLLLTAGRYKSATRMSGSFKEWNGAALEVTSDILLSHAPIEVGDENHFLPLLAKESFLWSGETHTITPVWNALQYPVRYYCDGLASPEAETRQIAVKGLRLLGDKDSVSCIEQTLRSEPDEALQRELREALASIAKP